MGMAKTVLRLVELEGKVSDLGCSVMFVFLVLYLFPAIFMAGCLVDSGYSRLDALASSLAWPVTLGSMLAEYRLGG